MLKQKAFIRHILLFDCTYSMLLNVAQLWTQSGHRFKNLGSVPLSHRSHVHPTFVPFSSHSPNIQVTWIGHSEFLISSQVVEALWYFFFSNMECLEDLTAYANPPKYIQYYFTCFNALLYNEVCLFMPYFTADLNAPWTHWGHTLIQLFNSHFLKTNRLLWCK